MVAASGSAQGKTHMSSYIGIVELRDEVLRFNQRDDDAELLRNVLQLA
jgi:hypothetical protein